MDNIKCNGNEDRLANCRHVDATGGNHDCGPQEAAGVLCASNEFAKNGAHLSLLSGCSQHEICKQDDTVDWTVDHTTCQCKPDSIAVEILTFIWVCTPKKLLNNIPRNAAFSATTALALRPHSILQDYNMITNSENIETENGAVSVVPKKKSEEEIAKDKEAESR